MSLTARLAATRQKFLSHPDGQQAYSEILSVLSHEFQGEIRGIGERFPDFILPDSDGRLATLRQFLADGPLVLTFFRGSWCPYCRATMTAFQEILPDVRALGAGLAAICPDTGGRLAASKREAGADYAYLCDSDCALALEIGLVMRLPDVYRHLLELAETDLPGHQGHGGWFVPVPASFIIDRDGVIRDRCIDLDFTQPTEPEIVLTRLRALVGPSYAACDNGSLLNP